MKVKNANDRKSVAHRDAERGDPEGLRKYHRGLQVKSPNPANKNMEYLVKCKFQINNT